MDFFPIEKLLDFFPLIRIVIGFIFRSVIGEIFSSERPTEDILLNILCDFFKTLCLASITRKNYNKVILLFCIYEKKNKKERTI